MSKPKTLTVKECTALIMIQVQQVLPLAAPEKQPEVVAEVTAELEAIPFVKPTEAKRHKKAS